MRQSVVAANGPKTSAPISRPTARNRLLARIIIYRETELLSPTSCAVIYRRPVQALSATTTIVRNSGADRTRRKISKRKKTKILNAFFIFLKNDEPVRGSGQYVRRPIDGRIRVTIIHIIIVCFDVFLKCSLLAQIKNTKTLFLTEYTRQQIIRTSCSVVVALTPVNLIGSFFNTTTVERVKLNNRTFYL